MILNIDYIMTYIDLILFVFRVLHIYNKRSPKLKNAGDTGVFLNLT